MPSEVITISLLCPEVTYSLFFRYHTAKASCSAETPSDFSRIMMERPGLSSFARRLSYKRQRMPMRRLISPSTLQRQNSTSGGQRRRRILVQILVQFEKQAVSY